MSTYEQAQYSNTPMEAEVQGGRPLPGICSVRGLAWLCGGAVLAGLLLHTLSGPVAQLILFPLVLVLAARIKLLRVCVPRAVIVSALCGALVSVMVRYSHVSLARGAFLVVSARDGELRKDAKIYRDRIRRTLRGGDDALVGVHYGEVSQQQQARMLLKHSPSLGGILWGSTRWMTVSLQEVPPLAFSDFPEGSVARDILTRQGFVDLYLARSVPSVGLSHGEQGATVVFMGGIIDLWREWPAVSKPAGDTGDFDARALLHGRKQALWNSQGHLALPLCLAATTSLVRAIEGTSLDVGELKCAIDEFSEALTALTRAHEPALRSVVLNNLAVALIAASDHQLNLGRGLSQARRDLVSAISKDASGEQGPMVAALNLKILGQREGGKRHARR